MTPEILAALAKKFDDDVVEHRPEVWCSTCKNGRWRCPEHDIAHCETCHQNVTTAHLDVPYIPHPHIRQRLDEVDPGWEWVPYAHDDSGRPAFDGGVLWILLTVGGKAVVGVGDAPGEVAGTNRRQSVTSAIRNAAESLGVGRYLRMGKPEVAPVPVVQLPERPVEAEKPTVDSTAEVAALIDKIIDLGADRRMNPAVVEAEYAAYSPNPKSKNLHSATLAELAGFFDHLKQVGK